MTLRVLCGIVSPQHNPLKENFWSVLKAIDNDVSFDAQSFLQPYHLVFSSKTAIEFFSEKIKNNLDIFALCKCIYFVGTHSAHYFKEEFPTIDASLMVSQQPGMGSLLREFSLDQQSERVIFVTASSGKSKKVIEATIFSSPVLNWPIYKLIPYQTDFLKDMFSSFCIERDKVIFECRSGHILAQATLFLMEYFSCRDTFCLPKNIYFSCFGQTTFDKVSELYGQHAAQRTY